MEKKAWNGYYYMKGGRNETTSTNINIIIIMMIITINFVSQ